MLLTRGEGKVTDRPSQAKSRALCTPGPAWSNPRAMPSPGAMAFLTPRCCSTWKTKDGVRSPAPAGRPVTWPPRLRAPHPSRSPGETVPSAKCQGPRSKCTPCPSPRLGHPPPRATQLVTRHSLLRPEPGKHSAPLGCLPFFALPPCVRVWVCLAICGGFRWWQK